MTEAREQKINFVLDHRQTNITLILENVFDPHNIAAVMRTADAIGMKEIYVVHTILPTHKHFGVRSSSSAIKWLQMHHFDNLDDCINAVKKKYSKIFTTHLSADAKSIYELNLTESVALAFGNEKYGLSEEILKIADGNFHIPQVGMIQSLNISVACAITLYEAYRQKLNAGQYKKRSVSEIEVRELMEFWDRKDEE